MMEVGTAFCRILDTLQWEIDTNLITVWDRTSDVYILTYVIEVHVASMGPRALSSYQVIRS